MLQPPYVAAKFSVLPRYPPDTTPIGAILTGADVSCCPKCLESIKLRKVPVSGENLLSCACTKEEAATKGNKGFKNGEHLDCVSVFISSPLKSQK